MKIEGKVFCYKNVTNLKTALEDVQTLAKDRRLKSIVISLDYKEYTFAMLHF